MLGRVGYRETRQRGSHIRLSSPGRKPITVPNYKTIDRSLPRKILRDAELSVDQFKKLRVRQLSDWYERHYTLNVGIASFLFIWQLIHLYWLTTHVVFYRLFDINLFNPTGLGQALIVIADYTEIPALILTSFVYIFGLISKFSWKNILFLFFLNSQWLHLFWITDEFVINQFMGVSSIILPVWLAWLAIVIDYLELPVIFDTLKKFFASLQKKSFRL